MIWDGRIIDGYDGFSEMFFRSIANEIHEYGTDVLIVDNITFLDRHRSSGSDQKLRTILFGVEVQDVS